MEDQAKILKFPEQPAIFTQDMKKRISAGISNKTDKPEEIVDEIEKIICKQIISMARNLGHMIGERIGKAICGAADNVYDRKIN